MRKTKILLTGYYGCGNLGDDALLFALLKQLKDAPVSYSVLLGDFNQSSDFLDAPWIPRMDLKKIRQAIHQHDVLVFGGGSLFQDITSMKSVLYYAMLVFYAKLARKKVFLLGQGIGPLQTPFGRYLAALAFKKADGITVRDPESFALLKKMGVRTPLTQTADLAFLLEPSVSFKKHEQNSSKLKIGIAPRLGKDLTWEQGINLFSEIARSLAKQGLDPYWVGMHLQEDFQLIESLQKQTGFPILTDKAHPLDLLDQLGTLDGMIAMRLHAGILATVQDLPVFMISYDPKVETFAKQMGFPFTDLEKLKNAEHALDLIEPFWNQEEVVKNKIKEKKEEMKLRALRNISFLFENLR